MDFIVMQQFRTRLYIIPDHVLINPGIKMKYPLITLVLIRQSDNTSR